MNFQFPRLTPTVKKLMILLAVSFVATAVLSNVLSVPVFQWMALDVTFMSRIGVATATGEPWWPAVLPLIWQPLTYWLIWPPVPQSFLNAGLTLLMIYFFHSPFEEAYGAKRMLQISAVGVLASALGCLLVGAALFPWVLEPMGQMPVYGAGVMVDAVIGAFPILFAGRSLYLIPFPFQIKPWAFVGLALGLVALQAVLASDPFIFVSGACAMGGGLAFAKWMTRPRGSKRPDLGIRKKRRSGPNLKVLKGGMDDDDEPPRWLN